MSPEDGLTLTLFIMLIGWSGWKAVRMANDKRWGWAIWHLFLASYIITGRIDWLIEIYMEVPK